MYGAAHSNPNFTILTFLRRAQINAETTAGGIAHWITSEIAGNLRTNATDWTAAYEPYVSGIIDAVVPNQVSEGGPILCTRSFHIADDAGVY